MKAAGLSRGPAQWTAALALGALLAAAALLRTIEHDDSQYVAAVALMRDGLPYRDFAYLQTPLQPLLLAPLAWLAEGWLFPVLRAINGLFGAAAAWILYRIVREQGWEQGPAWLAAACLVCSHPFLVGATQARNDSLALLLHAGGLLLLLRVWREEAGARTAFAAGLLLAAAASAKISYGIPAAAAGLAAMLQLRRLGGAAVAAFAAGGLAGLLPSLLLLAAAPQAFVFGVFRYPIEAPVEWRTLLGEEARLHWPDRVARIGYFLALGPALLALVVVAVERLRRGGERGRPAFLLDLLILAGLVAAVLPIPAFAQYAIPVLPALYARFAPIARSRRWATWLALLLLPVGWIGTGRDLVVNLEHGRWPALAARADGRWAGSVAPAGPLAGLAPEALVDSGRALDPRFAAGPFLFRTLNVLTPAEARAFRVVNRANFQAELDRAPPAGLLLGSEARPIPGAPAGLDGLLAGWALSRGYRPRVSLSGRQILWVRPAGQPDL